MSEEKMITIRRTKCVVVSKKLKNSANKKHNIWRIIEHPDTSLIGLSTVYGLPRAAEYPIGTEHITLIRIPQ